jgi:hypothetical protein
MRRTLISVASAAFLAAGAITAPAQQRTMTSGSHRMEISLERQAHDGTWKTIDPGLVLAQGDRVRFRFRANFDGYLYVTNQSTSGKYDQLFPLEETGSENHISAGQEYRVPATSTAFRIAGPAGHEIVYWLVSPSRLTDAPHLSPERKPAPLTLMPRCDDAVLRARGDCVDSSAGLKLVPRDIQVPEALSDAAQRSQRDLLFMRKQDSAVVSSPAALTGPVIYEFLLAHR